MNYHFNLDSTIEDVNQTHKKKEEITICLNCEGTGVLSYKPPYIIYCENCKGHGIVGFKWNFDLASDIKMVCIGCGQGFYYEHWHKPKECFERMILEKRDRSRKCIS